MGAFSITGKVDGLKQVMLRLDAVKRGPRKGILRKMVRAGGGIVNKAAKAAVKPVQTGSNVIDRSKIMNRLGLLRESLGVKVKTYRNDGVAVAVIGPRRGLKKQIGTRLRDGKKSKAGDPVYEDPANIAHLVEFGHGGPRPAPPHPFMRPAWDGSRGTVRGKMADVAETDLAKLARGG